MRKYIDSEAFFKAINTLPYKDTSYPDASAYNGAISDVADMLTHFPAAEVQEVRRGSWVGIDDEPCDVWECDQCGHIVERECPPRFCEECGAKMDEVKE